MTDQQLEKLVARAKQLNNYSEKYIQSVMYAERDSETSIDDIHIAVRIAKNFLINFTDKEIMYKMTGSMEFLKAEIELKKAASKLVEIQMRYERHYQLPPVQSNRILQEMINGIKSQLFTESSLHEKY